MKTNIMIYYRKHDNLSKYVTANRARLKQLSHLFSSNKRFFGRKVLDIACGGGVLGFIVEREGRAYTGVDVNPDMIAAARSYAREVGSANRFKTGDALRMKFDGTFDTICILGNALCHFSTRDFSRTVQRISPHIKRGGYLIADYRDLVLLMFNKRWNVRKKLVKGGRVSATKGCDTSSGFVLVATADLDGENRVGFAHAIWSPFIIEPIMIDHGWTLVRRRFSKRWSGWLDIYRRA